MSHDFRSLVEWKRLLREHAWTSGIVFVDIDEVGNVLRVGVENADVQQRVRAQLISLGMPAQGLVVDVSGRAVPEADLTDKFRPIRDAAFIVYDSASLGEHGLIARTLWLGSKTINTSHPRFTINTPSYTFLPVGATINKMGKTTGWTQGTVLSTCIDVEWTVESENDDLATYLLCQFGGSYESDGGDSGGPIFSWNGSGSSVDLRGLHNGRRFVGSSERIFSPWRFIDLELNAYVGWLDIAY